MGQTVDLAPALWLTTQISGTPTDAGGPYAEQQLNYMLQAIRGNASGLVQLGDLLVSPLSPTAGAQILVSPGGCWIAGSSSPALQGVYLVRSVAQQTLDVPAASTSIPRNDIVVVRVLDAVYDGSPVSGVSYRTRIEYIQGSQTTGAAPAQPANTLLLAKILVPAGSSTVVNLAAITNIAQFAALTAPGLTLGTGGINMQAPTVNQGVGGVDVKLASYRANPDTTRGELAFPSGSTAISVNLVQTFRTIRVVAGGGWATTLGYADLEMTFNNVAASYWFAWIFSSGGSVASTAVSNTTYGKAGELTSSAPGGASNSDESTTVITIPAYSKSRKHAWTWQGMRNTSGVLTTLNGSGAWAQPVPVTSIQFRPGIGSDGPRATWFSGDSGNFIDIYGVP